jgi:hypothetical protein
VKRIFDALDIEAEGIDNEVDECYDQDDKIVGCISLDEVFLSIFVVYLEPFTQNAIIDDQFFFSRIVKFLILLS